MKPPPDPHYRHRFSAEIISHAVWLYHVFSLSLRDVELLLAERGIVVSYETVRRWCQKFAHYVSLLTMSGAFCSGSIFSAKISTPWRHSFGSFQQSCGGERVTMNA
jgi:hypothetical protein